MADSYLEAITQLKTSTSSAAQIASARHIKNGLIGHPENKETFIRHGLIDALADVLATPDNSRSNTVRDDTGSGVPLTEKDEVRLQVILLLDSLVSGRQLLPMPSMRSRLTLPNRRACVCVTSPKQLGLYPY